MLSSSVPFEDSHTAKQRPGDPARANLTGFVPLHCTRSGDFARMSALKGKMTRLPARPAGIA